jgi:hypothetical protein
MEAGVDTGNASGSSAAPRWRFALVLALLLAVGVVVAIVLGTRSRSPSAAGNPSSAGGAAIVQRRDLVETDTESGTLAYTDPQTVYNRLSGTITWLPAVGQLIKPGQTLYRVNGRPVVLLDGALPAYRALKANDGAGRDILQLNRDLMRMGFGDGQITIDDTWQAGTTDAVERWQASLGDKQTGKIALGRIVFLPGAQRITQLDTTCGSTGSGSSSGSSSGSGSGQTNGCGVSDASATLPASHPEFVELTTPSSPTPTTTPTTTTPTTTTPTTTTTTTTSTATTPTTTTTPSTTSTTPKTTKPPSRHKPGGSRSGSGKGSGNGSSNSSHSGKGSTGSGSGTGNASGSGKGSGSGSSSGSGKGPSGSDGSSGAGSATAILQTTSTKLVVTVDLSASNQSEAKVGEPVTVEMPVGNTVNGKITAVSSVAQSSSSSGSGAGSGSGTGSGSGSSGSTIPVTITLSGQHSRPGLDQAAVSVCFAQAQAHNVLSVPVTALLATAGGGYAVQQTTAPHRLIPVTTGLFAAGYVQISGAGIYPGLQVTDSQG